MLLLRLILAAQLVVLGSAQGTIAAIVREAEAAGVRTGVAVRNPDAADTWFAHREHDALIPASNQKLLTVAGALHALGSEFEFTTGFAVEAGVLVVYAGGDPNWETGGEFEPERMLSAVAERLLRAGVGRLRDVRLDLGPFTGPARPEGWPLDQRERAYCAPTGGLLLDGGCFVARISSTRAASADIEILSPPGGYPLSGSIRMTSDQRKGSVYRLHQTGGEVRLSGAYWNRADGQTVKLAVEDPADAFERALRHVFARRGIVFDPGAEPTEVERFDLRTPLSETLHAILAESSNVHAEQLLRVLGAFTTGDGSVAGGRAALRRALEAFAGPLPNRVEIADGSGLSRGNRVSAGYLVCLIESLLRSEHVGPFVRNLAQGGVDGTLDRRFRDAPLRGRVRGKTGTINRVSALSGIVRGRGDRLQVFSILMNVARGKRVSARQMRRWQDRIVAAIHSGP